MYALQYYCSNSKIQPILNVMQAVSASVTNHCSPHVLCAPDFVQTVRHTRRAASMTTLEMSHAPRLHLQSTCLAYSTFCMLLVIA